MKRLTRGETGFARWWRVAAFAGGLGVVSLAFASLNGVTAWLNAYSVIFYVVLGVYLVVAGIAGIARAGDYSPACRQSHATGGASFLAGAALSAFGSPCCNPLTLALGGAGLAVQPAARGEAIAGAFLLGHIVPVVAAASTWPARERLRRVVVPQGTVATVAGALSFAIGGYYLLLA